MNCMRTISNQRSGRTEAPHHERSRRPSAKTRYREALAVQHSFRREVGNESHQESRHAVAQRLAYLERVDPIAQSELFGTPHRYGHPRDRCGSLDPGGTVDLQRTITRPNRALERTRESVVSVRLTPRSF